MKAEANHTFNTNTPTVSYPFVGQITVNGITYKRVSKDVFDNVCERVAHGIEHNLKEPESPVGFTEAFSAYTQATTGLPFGLIRSTVPHGRDKTVRKMRYLHVDIASTVRDAYTAA